MRVRYEDKNGIISIMMYVMSLIDFLFLVHPLISIVALACIVFVAKTDGAYGIIVMGILFVIALHHDKTSKK